MPKFFSVLIFLLLGSVAGSRNGVADTRDLGLALGDIAGTYIRRASNSFQQARGPRVDISDVFMIRVSEDGKISTFTSREVGAFSWRVTCRGNAKVVGRVLNGLMTCSQTEVNTGQVSSLGGGLPFRMDLSGLRLCDLGVGSRVTFTNVVMPKFSPGADSEFERIR